MFSDGKEKLLGAWPLPLFPATQSKDSPPRQVCWVIIAQVLAAPTQKKIKHIELYQLLQSGCELRALDIKIWLRPLKAVNGIFFIYSWGMLGSCPTLPESKKNHWKPLLNQMLNLDEFEGFFCDRTLVFSKAPRTKPVKNRTCRSRIEQGNVLNSYLCTIGAQSTPAW